VADLELATYVADDFERTYVVPLALHETNVQPAAGTNAIPVVVHAPSDRRYKGTAAIEEAVEGLKRRVAIDFRLLSGVRHDVVARELAAADVAIDQLDSVTTGVFALEAMRVGIPVLSQIEPSALPPYQDDLPVVPVTPGTLEGELELLIGDPERRRRLGERGRRYVERVHSPARVAAAMLRVYSHARSDATGLFEVTADGIRPLDEPRIPSQASPDVSLG
jgi:glycosyltransferase involved in cell wall biosynthesis